MTLYHAVQQLQYKGYSFIKRYPEYEIWTKGNVTITLPCMDVLPKYVERLIRRG